MKGEMGQQDPSWCRFPFRQRPLLYRRTPGTCSAHSSGKPTAFQPCEGGIWHPVSMEKIPVPAILQPV